MFFSLDSQLKLSASLFRFSQFHCEFNKSYFSSLLLRCFVSVLKILYNLTDYFYFVALRYEWQRHKYTIFIKNCNRIIFRIISILFLLFLLSCGKTQCEQLNVSEKFDVKNFPHTAACILRDRKQRAFHYVPTRHPLALAIFSLSLSRIFRFPNDFLAVYKNFLLSLWGTKKTSCSMPFQSFFDRKFIKRDSRRAHEIIYHRLFCHNFMSALFNAKLIQLNLFSRFSSVSSRILFFMSNEKAEMNAKKNITFEQIEIDAFFVVKTQLK